MLAWAPYWGWIVAANVLLGLNQGLTWSMTVNMKIDLVGPARRGLATGLNEAAGYTAVGVTALLTGYLATSYGLRPFPSSAVSSSSSRASPWPWSSAIQPPMSRSNSPTTPSLCPPTRTPA